MELQQSGNHLLLVPPGDNGVHEPVLQQELRRLEPLGQGLAGGLLHHPGPAKPTVAPGSARMMSPSMAKLAVTPPVVGSVRTVQ